jgi:hypothetical protein
MSGGLERRVMALQMCVVLMQETDERTESARGARAGREGGIKADSEAVAVL